MVWYYIFFEMLGNFFFGDYFKEGVIEFVWDLFINGYKLLLDKFWVFIYLDDDEVYELWYCNIGVLVDWIVWFGEKDNFWFMGDMGFCGFCLEIIIDCGLEYGCGKFECIVGCECDWYLEIWNLVFM